MAFLMPFGKFKYVAIEDVPERYLHYCVDYYYLDPDLQATIKYELMGRSAKRLIGLLKHRCSADTAKLVRTYIHQAEAEGYQHPLLDELKGLCEVETVSTRPNK